MSSGRSLAALPETWDYIIVGGGTAGTVLAARLSADPSPSVLLLEAGPDYDRAQLADDFVGTIDYESSPWRHPELYWMGLQVRRNPIQNERLYLVGRGLGGSSTVNAMMAFQAEPDDYDGWARAGASGWAQSDILHAIQAFEDDRDFPEAPYHGQGGPIPIERVRPDQFGPLSQAFAEACDQIGLLWCDDHNAPGTTGVSPLAMSWAGGRRSSTYDGYLEPARRRDNLTVLADTMVDRVAIQGQRSTGVLSADGRAYSLAPGGEVIVSAGAIHSAAILMRSGIGPARVMERLGIDTVADLPVGTRVQDHPGVIAVVPTSEGYLRQRGQRQVDVCLRYSSGLAGAGVNDVTVMPLERWHTTPTVLGCKLSQVFSTGSIEIVATDPHVEPRVELNLLVDKRDTIRLANAVERLREIGASPAMTRLLSGPIALPEAQNLPHVIADTHHVSSSCPLGSPSDPDAVVDSSCRVLGIEGLRVVDASIMPTVPRANTHLPTLTLAEHSASLIIATPARAR